METNNPVSDPLTPPTKIIWVRQSQIAFCPSCKKEYTTRVEYKPGPCSWISCGCCVMMGCVLGCCILPFCWKSTQDCIHYCPSCNNFINRKTPIC